MPSRMLARAVNRAPSTILLLAVLAALPALSQLVIRGSFGRSALLFDDDVLTGVVDFDRARLEYLDADLAYAIKGFGHDRDKESIEYGVAYDPERCGNFMRGYREMMTLPEADLIEFPTICRAQRLVKVMVKTKNFVERNVGEVPKEKKFLKIEEVIELQARRLRWLERYEGDLVRMMSP